MNTNLTRMNILKTIIGIFPIIAFNPFILKIYNKSEKYHPMTHVFVSTSLLGPIFLCIFSSYSKSQIPTYIYFGAWYGSALYIKFINKGFMDN